MKKLRIFALLAVALTIAAPLLTNAVHAQVIVQDIGLQQFCGNWGWDGGNTCMGLSGQLYKDDTEQDPNHDIYTVVARVWDPVNDGYQIADMWLTTNTQTSVSGGPYQPASLDKYDPQAGYQTTQSPITFTYAGISVGILLPATQTDVYQNANYYSALQVQWESYHICCNAFPIPNPGYAEFAVAFNVPEGASVYITVYLQVRFADTVFQYYGGWTPTYGISFQYPPPPPPPRCPPVC